ncbi:hypothetical protein AYI69_g5750 [Smittium culicis]|uniref:Uncharacterized protein n=1 Tax=Smittium culicis TaxID=133412 RepID=A0A1R1Y3T0_9FUNG|nr:hypothetical protein AYI69_g5750 [Smittium culicis]
MNIKPRDQSRGKVQVIDATKVGDSKGKSFGNNTKLEYKLFMSSKIDMVTKTAAEHLASSKTKKSRTEGGDEEEEEGRQRDKELKELLDTSRLIDELSNSAVAGKERLKYQEKKMMQLGLDKKKKERKPRDLFYGIQEKKQTKASKEIEQARLRGVLTNSVKRQIEEKHLVAEINDMKSGTGSGGKKRKSSSGGVNLDKGRFRNGTLFVSKAAIKKNETTNKKSAFRRS